jgi:hypothetical protein
MTSESEQKFREHIIVKLAEHSTSITNIYKNTERILTHLDILNGRVSKTERELSLWKGISGMLFGAFGFLISLIFYLN